ASARPGPLQDLYLASIAKGIKPTMARLTLARKIAAITDTVEKRRRLRRKKTKITSRLSVSVKSPSISGDLVLVVANRFLRRSGSRVSIRIACRHVPCRTECPRKPYAPSDNRKKP